MRRIAKILKSNGTDGGLLVSAPEVGIEEILEPVFIVFDGLPVPFFINDCTQRGSCRYIVHLNDICCLEDAEEVVGKDIFLDSADSDAATDNDFTGWTLLNRGKTFGKISGYEPIPGNLCLYVETSAGQVMVPLNEDFIIGADSSSKTLDLDLPDGLV